MNYERTCFVIMPFGVKKVGRAQIDFDAIYDEVFAPAIAAVALPEGGTLIPKRTDKDPSSGHIEHEMFQYLEYSRIALADLTGLNANVMYELGVRHRAREAGTALFRQEGVQIPFDIAHVKVFPYARRPRKEVAASRARITGVLRETLMYNRIDNGVALSLRAQQAAPEPVEGLLEEARNALLNHDLPAAATAYRSALRKQPGNPLVHHSLGMILKLQSRWEEALTHFQRATELNAAYPDAHRELGIAQNRVYGEADPRAGEVALRTALALNPEDFDAHASLGGVLKRARRLSEAAEQYRRAAEVSGGHPYPLLNALKLAAIAKGRWEMDARTLHQLGQAEAIRAPQVRAKYDAPWSFFDLAEIRLYQGQPDEFERLARAGAQLTRDRRAVETFRHSLGMLPEHGVQVPGLGLALGTLDTLRDLY